MKKRRYLLKEKNGSATILDAIIAIGIAIAIFMVFIYYTNALYTIQNEPGVDLELKSVGLMETLIKSPGQSGYHYPEWQEDPRDILKALGLSTSRTIQYGTLQLVGNNVENIFSLYPKADSIGMGNTCFLAGTQIVMADESYKNIEDIKAGDFVKSYDENSQRIEDKQVTHIFHHTPDEMGDYYLLINNQLRVTPNHRFYIDGEWIFADELKIGDSLFYPSTHYSVFSIEKIFERTYTYNFEVEGYHNYFVEMNPTDVLVHNAGLTINVTFNPNNGYPGPIGSAPCKIIFDCNISSGNRPFKYIWNFGEGYDITENNVYEFKHTFDYTYTIAGTYDVKINITDSIGDTGEVSINDIQINPGPVATFAWFDEDGPFNDSGYVIRCNASFSSYSGDSPTFQWYKDNIYLQNKSTKIVSINLGDSNTHKIKLKLTDKYLNSDSYEIEVQANVPPYHEIDSKPWVLTGKEVYPDSDNDTFQSYLTNYYVKYTLLEEGHSNIKYLLFEVKEKTNNEQPIIDENKIKNLERYNNLQSYNDIKSALGLNSKQVDYNFCIEITIYDENGAVDDELFFGASDDNSIAKASTTKQVLVYDPPTAIKIDDSHLDFLWVIESHPTYKQAEVTISVFLGGKLPPEIH